MVCGIHSNTRLSQSDAHLCRIGVDLVDGDDGLVDGEGDSEDDNPYGIKVFAHSAHICGEMTTTEILPTEMI